MLARERVYVDPFDRICLGLGGHRAGSPRNHRPEGSGLSLAHYRLATTLGLMMP